MNKLVVPIDAAGMRIDVFLANFAHDIATRSAAQKLLEAGKVTVGEKNVLKRHLVKEGDEVFYEPCTGAPIKAAPENIPLEIIYEDDDILIVNKPKGMVVHSAPGHYTGTLVNALLFHTKNKLSALGGEIRPGIVHRLDRDTSGLMAVAKNDFAHSFLAGQLLNREMGRAYLAVCHGRIKEDEFTIDLPIGRHPKNRKKMAVNPARGKPAITHVRAIERVSQISKSATLIEAKLSTGRTHQIRVHMSYINHPVLGDEIYGTGKSGGGGQILHAKKLVLLHPQTGNKMEFDAPLPDYFKKALERLKIAMPTCQLPTSL